MGIIPHDGDCTPLGSQYEYDPTLKCCLFQPEDLDCTDCTSYNITEGICDNRALRPGYFRSIADHPDYFDVSDPDCPGPCTPGTPDTDPAQGACVSDKIILPLRDACGYVVDTGFADCLDCDGNPTSCLGSPYWSFGPSTISWGGATGIGTCIQEIEMLGFGGKIIDDSTGLELVGMRSVFFDLGCPPEFTKELRDATPWDYDGLPGVTRPAISSGFPPIYAELVSIVCVLGVSELRVTPTAFTQCYEAVVTACPNHTEGDPDTECVPECLTPDCPANYTWNSSTELCERETPFGMAILMAEEGHMHIATPYDTGSATRIKYRTADTDVSPLVNSYFATTPSTGGYDIEPCLLQDWRLRINLLFTRIAPSGSTNVYYAYSDDEGETWSTAVSLFTGAHHPGSRIHPDTGDELYMAYRSNRLVGKTRTAQTATFSSEFTTQYFDGASLVDLEVEDDSFGLEVSLIGEEIRWKLVAREQGSSDVSIFWSTDEGETWTKE